MLLNVVVFVVVHACHLKWMIGWLLSHDDGGCIEISTVLQMYFLMEFSTW